MYNQDWLSPDWHNLLFLFVSLRYNVIVLVSINIMLCYDEYGGTQLGHHWHGLWIVASSATSHHQTHLWIIVNLIHLEFEIIKFEITKIPQIAFRNLVYKMVAFFSQTTVGYVRMGNRNYRSCPDLNIFLVKTTAWCQAGDILRFIHTRLKTKIWCTQFTYSSSLLFYALHVLCLVLFSTIVPLCCKKSDVWFISLVVLQLCKICRM